MIQRIFSSFDIAATGLTAQRLRMDVIANNLANVNTTRTETGLPYRRQEVVFVPKNYPAYLFPMPPVQEISNESLGEGVKVLKIVEDPSPFRMEYKPGHPDANEEGYVAYPNVNPVTEMVDLISASRSYEANIAVIQSAKSMLLKTLEIGR